jgi:DNA-binding transcriptional LysR family regulator
MELRQLEYFVAVAEEANFTRAAERVRISQSGVSAQVKQLESELGAELFDRSARVTRLTVAGTAALPHARAALDAAARARQAVDDVTGLVRGRLTVGMIMGCTITPFFDALAGFHQAHPAVEIALQEEGSAVLIDNVRAGRQDLALVGVAGAPPADLSSQVIISEGLIAAVPADHPLAREAGVLSVDLVTLCAYKIVCLPVGTGIRSVFDQACAARGLRPEVALQATAPAAVADLAARGLGVAVLSATMAVDLGDLTVLPIDGITIPALLAVIWRDSHSPAVRSLLPHLDRAFTARS